MAHTNAHRRAAFTVVVTTLIMSCIVPAGAAAARTPAPIITAVRGVPTFSSSRNVSGTVVAQARRHLGAGYQSGGTGPRFDCSGLVYRVFADSGLLSKIGGSRRSSSGFYAWFKARHQVSRSAPRVGDLVVYGYSGYASHVGIYIGGGRVISALVDGVTDHGTFVIYPPFMAYLHTGLS